VLDVRPKNEFGAGHLRGAVNIPLIKAFTTWSGWLFEYDRPIAIIANDVIAAETARTALASIGLDNVTGWFGPEAVAEAMRRDGTATARLGDINEAESLMASGRTVIDLREQKEWDAGHIDGAVHRPLGTIRESMAGVDPTTPIAVHCQAGTRSAIGASVLESMGFTDVVDLTAGWSGRRA
jgi:hydroxyacylglutathione hydrolase